MIDSKTETQMHEILDLVLSFAKLDFTRRANIYGENDLVDALSGGINMLGEELQNSTISLQQKEILLKEIHHRIKNNLQIVSSILNLQSAHTKEPAIKHLLNECRSRIISIALVHEKLYESVDLHKVNLNDYIESLCESLLETFTTDHIKFRFISTGDNCMTHIDEILPLGLILTELFTNALKHAYPEDREGKLNVSLNYEDDKIELVVSDDGPGIENKNKLTHPETLGLQLVQALVEQINGSIELLEVPGSTIRLTLVREEK